MTSTDYTGRDNLEAMQEARRYNEFLLSLVRRVAVRNEPIVDFGAGIGTFASILASEGFSVQCVETDCLQASLIRSMGLPVASELRDLPASSITLVYSFNVLEHIEHDEAAIAEVFSALRPGGQLLVYVPAFPVLFSSMDRKVGHIRRYTRKALESKLAAAGFEVEFIRYADSLGFLAALAFRFFGNNSGEIDRNSVAFYDRWVFPISQISDRVLSRLVGKNLVALARKPLADLRPS